MAGMAPRYRSDPSVQALVKELSPAMGRGTCSLGQDRPPHEGNDLCVPQKAGVRPLSFINPAGCPKEEPRFTIVLWDALKRADNLGRHAQLLLFSHSGRLCQAPLS